MTGVEVSVWAEVHPTESREKVETAVRNVLGDVELMGADRGDITVLEGSYEGLESLGHLNGMLRRARIRGAARALFTRSAGEGVLSFGLNKQAAYAGYVSFYRSGESALGPIQITVKGDVARAMEYLCGFGP